MKPIRIRPSPWKPYSLVVTILGTGYKFDAACIDVDQQIKIMMINANKSHRDSKHDT